MIKSIMNSKELLILIHLQEINQGEDRLKLKNKKVSLDNRKIKIRIRDPDLV